MAREESEEFYAALGAIAKELRAVFGWSMKGVVDLGSDKKSTALRVTFDSEANKKKAEKHSFRPIDGFPANFCVRPASRR